MPLRYFTILTIIAAVFSAGCKAAEVNAVNSKMLDGGWFPVQKVPKGVIKTVNPDEFEEVKSPSGKTAAGAFSPTHMLAQSLSGLAAKAVNEGSFDEMVWIDTERKDYKYWYKNLLERLEFEERGTFEVWDILRRYMDAGIVKGYILYSYDFSEGGAYTERENIDRSANVAATVAGLTNAVMISDGQKQRADKMGLKMIMDVRGKDMNWCYAKYRNVINRNALLTVDPKVANNRALSIANGFACAYGVEESTERLCKLLKSPAPIFGWNCGDEAKQTGLVTGYGNFQTASNWAYNLPLLSAGSAEYEPAKVKTLNPAGIDWNDQRYPVAMLMSDGDNLQWLTGNFFFNDSYWASQHHGDFPMSWTTCVSHLVQACPEVADYLAASQPDNAAVIEYGAGYYYPDLFGEKRYDRLSYLRRHAKDINEQLKKSGTKVFGFITMDCDSEDAFDAYKVYAEELDSVIGMVAIQYYPYNGGNGEVFWFKNSSGVEIPVITATHSTWEHARWKNGGTPSHMARLVNEQAAKNDDPSLPDYSLLAMHAWSQFQEIQGSDDKAEDIPRDENDKLIKRGKVGLEPAKWFVDRLDTKTTQVVNIEEIIWRVRMKHDPVTTKKIINEHYGRHLDIN
ncbi:GxGYxYP domain-containing protein [Limihaloglobus sulfuriphilus]|nr:GxGYxYP domain-containing protein [Limihaloglobus sulfuriphilus]